MKLVLCYRYIKNRNVITHYRLITSFSDEVNKAMARIAYRKMGTAISALKPDEDDNALTPQKVVSIESKQGKKQEQL